MSAPLFSLLKSHNDDNNRCLETSRNCSCPHCALEVATPASRDNVWLHVDITATHRAWSHRGRSPGKFELCAA